MMPTRALRPSALLVPLALVFVAACGGGEEAGDAAMDSATPDPAAQGPIVVADVGLSTPESVLHDPRADVYLVSNIAGAPLDADGNGFISRISPDGEVLDLRWIDGASEGVTLDAPKGLALDGDLLYVADIRCIRTFDRSSGAPVASTCLDGASFLNDVAPHPEGGVVFTDSGLDAGFGPTGTDAVYRLVDGQVTPLMRDPTLGAPNGVTVSGGEPLVVTFGSGRVFRLGADGTPTPVAQVEGAQFDGVVVLDDGRILVSDWTTSCVQVLEADGTVRCLIADVEAPADIGFDTARNRVLIPLFNASAVRIVPIG